MLFKVGALSATDFDFLLGAGGGGDNGCLLRASAIIVLDKRLEYALGVALLLHPLMLN